MFLHPARSHDREEPETFDPSDKADLAVAMPVVRWLVAGRVQGVGFRWFVQRAAAGHGIDGDVRNLGDGSVEIRARGTAASLERLLAEVRVGPPSAHVTGVEVQRLEGTASFHGFRVRS